MRIFVDADSCPVKVKEIICKRAQKSKIETIFVANRKIKLPPSPFLKFVLVDPGEGVGDRYIEDNIESGDLVITRDIPFAALLVEQDLVGAVINDRGQYFNEDTIKERLSIRNSMAEMRVLGLTSMGKNNYGPKEAQAFANCFDMTLTKLSSD